MSIFRALERIKNTMVDLLSLSQRLDDLHQSIGRIERRQLQQSGSTDLQSHEFKVFSQWGEDGIIQYLIDRIQIPNPVFVEFGVGDYRESNTRFLLRNNNWKGLVIDGSRSNMDRLAQSNEFWQHNLKADCAFITRSNINELISRNDITGDIGILSVDIDGNDYWVWEAITCISPRIVICEYNSLFGANAAVSTPYQDDFQIFKAHHSGLYWGASIAAFNHVASQKGYSLVGSNAAGNNIFFVRNDAIDSLKKLSPAEAHVESQFRISRNQQGQLSYLDKTGGLAVIAELPLVDVITGMQAPAGALVV
jgi:hypothetical protein